MMMMMMMRLSHVKNSPFQYQYGADHYPTSLHFDCTSTMEFPTNVDVAPEDVGMNPPRVAHSSLQDLALAAEFVNSAGWNPGGLESQASTTGLLMNHARLRARSHIDLMNERRQNLGQAL